MLEPGDLSLTDGTSTSEGSWPGVGGTKLVLIDYDQLGPPVDLVHRAVPQLGTGSVYRLVRAHGAQAMTIAAIARGWGFADATHFAKRFRGAYGMSPRECQHL
ncbi:MAG TPA: helix-turn-helix domain-containing protein [Trebonia sp.]